MFTVLGSGMTIGEAARALGISPEAVRQRIRRGTLPASKIGDRWYVQTPPAPDTSLDGELARERDRQQADSDAAALRELIARLTDEVAFLRSELAARNEELRRKDELIAALLQRLR